MLRMRVSWLWGMLHDYQGEIQLSFHAGERTFEFAQQLKSKYNDQHKIVPGMEGSELSAYTWEGLESVDQEPIICDIITNE